MGNGNGGGSALARTSDHGGGEITRRDGFGETEITRRAETSITAAAEQSRAMVQARYVMALQRPRDIEDVRVRLLKECRRPGFAAVARYAKPVGGKSITGPSIRFAEAAARIMGNVDISTPTLYDDSEKRLVRVAVSDLETNTTFSIDITIEKVVERRDNRGRETISVRENSEGKMVYLVAATEDEMLVKQSALVSKAIRTNVLRVVPGDIVEECMEQVVETQRSRDKADPDAALRKVVDAFAAINVGPGELRRFLGHDVATVVPAELTELRAVYAAIKDGETTWHAVIEARANGETAPATTDGEKPSAGGRASKARDAVKQAAAKRSHDPATGEVAEEDLPPLDGAEPGSAG
ncbi:MAG: hypothetical protein IT374_26060 [Polyangiaceae bacterium]|nr:hypothetical protein [Polyangiaceae bacterium]